MNFRITELWAYVCVDAKSNDEGIIGRLMPDGTWIPFIGADEARVRSLRPMAEKIGKESKAKVRLMKFSTKTLVEEF
jgi:hypothetical protein